MQTDAHRDAYERKIPTELLAAMRAMHDGKLPFAKFRDELANTLYLDFRLARHIESWLEYCESIGDLPAHLHKVLSSDIERICAEDVPTLIDTHAARASRVQAADDQPASKAAEKLTAPEGEETLEKASVAEFPTIQSVALGSVLAGRYEVLERADGGNMSVVFKAHDRQAPRDQSPYCAIKLLTPAMATNGRALRALQDEYEKGALIDHPNVVNYRALERDESLIFVTMEWLEGETLAQQLNRQPGVSQSLELTRHVISQVAAALDATHKAGIVHADLKPGNLMVKPDGSVCLFDFGVARAFGARREQRIGFDAGVLAAATPAYASARVLDGDLPSPTDDYYSLACIAYRMLSGARVFSSLNANEAREQGVLIPQLDALSDEQFAMLVQYLNHDSGQRPITSEQMVAALSQLPDPKTRSTGPAPVGMPKTYWVGAAAALAVIALASWLLLGDRSTESAAAVMLEPTTAVEANVVAENSVAAPTAQTPVDFQSETDEGGDVEVDPAFIESSAASIDPESTELTNTEPTSLPSVERDNWQMLIRSGGAVTESRTLAAADGPVNVIVRADDTSVVPQDVRVYLMPLAGVAPPHTLSLDGENSARIGAGNTLTVALVPYASDTLGWHRDYQLVVVADNAEASLLGATRVRVPNEALLDIAQRSESEVVGFLSAELEVNEGDGVIRVPLVRLNGSADDWSGEIQLSSSTAIEGDDYFAPVSNSVTFSAADDQQNLLLPLVNDGVRESPEVLQIDVIGPGVGAGLVGRISVTVYDDD